MTKLLHFVNVTSTSDCGCTALSGNNKFYDVLVDGNTITKIYGRVPKDYAPSLNVKDYSKYSGVVINSSVHVNPDVEIKKNQENKTKPRISGFNAFVY